MATKKFYIYIKYGNSPEMVNSNQNSVVWAENAAEARKKALEEKKNYKYVEILSIHTEYNGFK
jgi:hypothetical protein